MKTVTKQQLKDMISSGELVRIPHQNHKPAKNPPELSTSVWPIRMEYDLSLYLIKVDNHYVPAKYLFYGDSGEENIEYRHDKYAKLPKINFDEKSNKWTVEFDGPDFGGYDVTDYIWYFDSLEDIIKEMRG